MTDSEILLRRVAFELETTRRSLYGDKGEEDMKQMVTHTARKTVYDFSTEIDELLCEANDTLSAEDFEDFLDKISIILAEWED